MYSPPKKPVTTLSPVYKVPHGAKTSAISELETTGKDVFHIIHTLRNFKT